MTAGRQIQRSGRRLLLPWLVVATVLASGCTSLPTTAPTPTPRVSTATTPAIRLTPVPGVTGDPEAGRRAFITAGCAGCHTLAGVEQARGLAGPILTNVVLRPTLAGETIAMAPETLTRFLLDPAAVKPGTSMPNVGLEEPEARDLTAYLYSLARTTPR
jgi:cytochrome c1